MEQWSGLVLTVALALSIVSYGAGLVSGLVYNDEKLKAKGRKYKAEMDEIYEEVKRLRAQVANLIGKE